VSTRRLITLALICGLAILVAGGVMLVRLVHDRDRLTIHTLAPSTPATVGGVRVRITAYTRTDGVARIVVAIDTPPDHGLADAAEGFSLNVGGLRDPQTPTDLAGTPACRGLVVAPLQSVSCALAFSDRPGSATLAYAHRGEQAEWSLGR
jgi:hypothetical protein